MDTLINIVCDLFDVDDPRDLLCFIVGSEPFDLAEALYCYCAQNHGGQSSPEYRALCRLETEARFRPGLSCQRFEIDGDAAELLELFESGEVTA